jgi:hypothetical protein
MFRVQSSTSKSLGRFKTFKTFKPPPPFDAAQDMLYSPAMRGRMKEGVGIGLHMFSTKLSFYDRF